MKLNEFFELNKEKSFPEYGNYENKPRNGAPSGYKPKKILVRKQNGKIAKSISYSSKEEAKADLNMNDLMFCVLNVPEDASVNPPIPTSKHYFPLMVEDVNIPLEKYLFSIDNNGDFYFLKDNSKIIIDLDDKYKMSDLYPSVYQTMTGIPNIENTEFKIKNRTDLSNMFSYCQKLTSIPQLDTSKVTNMRSMFESCWDLVSVPQLNTSEVTSTNGMFINCNKLTSIPQLDTSKVIYMSGMFSDCLELTSIPQLNTSKVIYMSSMFSYCQKLTSIPQLDTSEVTDMSYMFNDCRKLTSIPQLNTSKVTNMGGIFSDCENLISIPQLDTSKVVNMNGMFLNCNKLTSIPQLDTSKVIDMRSMFSSCQKLTTIPTLDISSIPDADVMKNILRDTKVTSVTFKNKPAHLQIDSQLLCGDPNQIKSINFV